MFPKVQHKRIVTMELGDSLSDWENNECFGETFQIINTYLMLYL